MAAREDAEAQVALKYDPQQAALDRALAAMQANTQAGEAGIQQYGATGRTNINDIYNTLGGLLGANRTNSANALNQQVANVGYGFDVADQVQRQAAQEGRDRLGTLAQQLGQQPAQMQVQSGLESLVANLLGRNAQEKAAATGNLGTWAAQWDQILGQGLNIGEQSRAKAGSELEAAIARLLGENKLEGVRGENDIRGRMADILAARQNDLVATFQQLSQRDWENAFKQAQLDQQASEANARLALGRDELNLKAQMAAADNAARGAAASRAGQLDMKDLIGLAMKQQEIEAGREQQAFENRMATEGLGLDRRKLEASLMGEEGPSGRDYLLDFVKDMGAVPDKDTLQQYSDFLGSIGLPVDYYHAPPPPATSGGGSNSGGYNLGYGGNGWRGGLAGAASWLASPAIGLARLFNR